jgi:hypothetical protein
MSKPSMGLEEHDKRFFMETVFNSIATIVLPSALLLCIGILLPSFKKRRRHSILIIAIGMLALGNSVFSPLSQHVENEMTQSAKQQGFLSAEAAERLTVKEAADQQAIIEEAKQQTKEIEKKTEEAATAVPSTTIACRTINDLVHYVRLLNSGDQVAADRLIGGIFSNGPCRIVSPTGYIEDTESIAGVSLSCLRHEGETNCLWTFTSAFDRGGRP